MILQQKIEEKPVRNELRIGWIILRYTYKTYANADVSRNSNLSRKRSAIGIKIDIYISGHLIISLKSNRNN